MALAPGTRLGPYEIVAALGAGGMGEVYRACDARLGRTVAIKVLSDRLAADSQFRERFHREARALSQLAHPYICTLHDVGAEEGITFLVMELLHGETLAARLERGPLPLRDALTTGVQIAQALEAAHRSGFIHRDLKPGNVMLTPTGAKLLDFGLAKTHAPAVSGVDGSMSPTAPARLTAPTTILGTLQYMAPEQIEGHEADPRTDLFAFGCVLYEMLTGQRAFQGQTHASLIAAILHVEPPAVSALQPMTSSALDRVVKRCLAKNADDRWQSARDLRDALEWVAEPGVGLGAANGAVPKTAVSSGWRRALPWVITVAFAAALGFVLWETRRTVPPAAPEHLSASLGADVSLPNSLLGTAVTLSPDGTIVAFVAQKEDGGSTQIYIRRLNQLQATPLSGTDDAQSPFFSPDGQWVAFFAGSKLKKIAVTGGFAVTVCDAPNGRGGAWAEDGTIVLSPNNVAPGTTLMRVSSDGGTPAPLSTLTDGETTHRWPQLLAGGAAVLFTSSSSYSDGAMDDATLVVQPLPTGARKIVLRGGYHGRYLPSGHLVYMHHGTLFAARFDLDRLEVTGESVPALDGVATDASTGSAQFAVSANGTLVYLPGQSTSSGVPIHWMDREGKATTLRASPTNWFNPFFAPEGRRLAVNILDTQFDIWVYDWVRDTLTQLTTDPAGDTKPVWTPDGRRIAFASARADKSTPNLYWQRADGIGDAERLTDSENPQAPGSWHPSGKFLAFEEQNPQTKYDLMMLPMEADGAAGAKVGKPTVFTNDPADEREPMFSPDGRWLAYSSSELGRNEVYVRSFPGPGGKWRISTGGGMYPSWSRTKQELVYGFNGQLMVAPFAVEGDSFRAEKPRPWSNERYQTRGQNRPFDLHPDGERLALSSVALAQVDTKRDHLTFIFNFFDELRRLTPTGRR